MINVLTDDIELMSRIEVFIPHKENGWVNTNKIDRLDRHKMFKYDSKTFFISNIYIDERTMWCLLWVSGDKIKFTEHTSSSISFDEIYTMMENGMDLDELVPILFL